MAVPDLRAPSPYQHRDLVVEQEVFLQVALAVSRECWFYLSASDFLHVVVIEDPCIPLLSLTLSLTARYLISIFLNP